MDNNSLVTAETIKTFNSWLADTYNITPSMISEEYNIPVNMLYYAVLNWRDSEASGNAIINTLPVWFVKALNQYVKSTSKFKVSINTTENDDSYGESRQYIFNLLERRASSFKANATGGTDLQFDIVNSIRIPVPEGFDGNLAYVKLIVPPEVITAMHTRGYGESTSTGDRDAIVIHPLLRATRTYFEGTEAFVDAIDLPGVVDGGGFDGGWGCSCLASFTQWGSSGPHPDTNTLTAQKHGNYRVNPIFFYSRYVEKQNLSIDVVKNQKDILINVNCQDFMWPFASVTGEVAEDMQLILPKIMVLITFYKYGAT